MAKAQIELAESWRKAGFLTEPFDTGSPEKAEEFINRLVDALDQRDFKGGQWTGGDVARGEDEAGAKSPRPLPAAG